METKWRNEGQWLFPREYLNGTRPSPVIVYIVFNYSTSIQLNIKYIKGEYNHWCYKLGGLGGKKTCAAISDPGDSDERSVGRSRDSILAGNSRRKWIGERGPLVELMTKNYHHNSVTH